MSQLSILNDLTHKNSDLTTYKDTKAGNVEDWCPTFLPDVDKVMLGGIPLSGKITEIFGDPSVGKTTFMIDAMRKLVKLGAIVVVFDIEGTTSNSRMGELGVDYSKVLRVHSKVDRSGIPRPITVEQIFHDIIKFSSEIYKQDPNRLVVFIWDTVADTLSKTESKAGVDNATMGQQARALSVGIKNIGPTLAHRNATLVCLNQARTRIGDMNPYTSKIPTTEGGKPFAHSMSLIFMMLKAKKLKANGSKTPYGHQARLRFVKSKIGANSGEVALIDVLARHGRGCDFYYNIYDEAKNKGLITGTAWQSYKSSTGKVVKEQGSANFIKFLRSKKGRPVVDDIWQRLVKLDFPDCYPALFNQRLDLSQGHYSFLKGMRKYYIKRQMSIKKDDRHFTFRNWSKLHPKDVKKALK